MAVMLASVAHAETCAPPNVPRAVVEPTQIGSEIVCPETGLCYRTSGWSEWTHSGLTLVCLSPADHAAAKARMPRYCGGDPRKGRL